MKRIAIILTLMLPMIMSVQSQTVQFSYDAAGNRVLRTIRAEKITKADTVFSASNEKEILSDRSIVGLRIFPNPTSTVLNIEFAILPQTPVEYTFSEISGRLLEEGPIISALTPLNLQNFGKGVYVLQVKTSSENEKFKIIKQ